MSIRAKRRKMLRWERWENHYIHRLPGLLATPGSLRAYNAWARQVNRKSNRELAKTWEQVTHTPRWEPADLPIDGDGNTRPGFICTHELENGNGQCGGNVFEIEDAIGDHMCIVRKEAP